MSYTLFLDDEREPQWFLVHDALVARDKDEFIAHIKEFGVPAILSFDHDLGLGESGHRCLLWLIDQHLDGKLNLNEVSWVIVHSHNPVGANNIAALWNGFAASEGINVQAEVKPWQQIPTFLVR